MATSAPMSRREFDWVTDLDDPNHYEPHSEPAPRPTPVRDGGQQGELIIGQGTLIGDDEWEGSPREMPQLKVRTGMTLRHMREFLIPVTIAIAYVVAVSGMRWWTG